MTQHSKSGSFDEWMRVVSAAVWRLAGMAADDLPDYCYRDAYEDGVRPVAAARQAVRAAREF